MKKLILTLLLTSISILSFGQIIVYESFGTGSDAVALANASTSDGNGSWQNTRTDTSGATGLYETGVDQFLASENPFGVGSPSVALQQSNGNDSTLAFTALAGGNTLYFSLNLNMIDVNSGKVHTISFQNDAASLTPTMRLTLTDGGDGTYDLSALSGNTVTDAITATRTSYFLYGKVDASADLTSWTLSANITDNLSTITSDSWMVTQVSNFGTARDGHANRMVFDTNGGRALFDEIRLGTTFADVTAVPEPSTYALLAGLATLGLVMARRRLIRA